MSLDDHKGILNAAGLLFYKAVEAVLSICRRKTQYEWTQREQPVTLNSSNCEIDGIDMPESVFPEMGGTQRTSVRF